MAPLQVPKLDLIAAACENMGIGKNNNLPWRLKTEMEYFTRMTSEVSDQSKKNVVIMGRKTWDSIPPKFKPLTNRLNFVLSRSNLDLRNYKDVYTFTSLEDALAKLQNEKFNNDFESVWVIGGSHIYEETMKSKFFHRIYMTKIMKRYDCDTFFPPISPNLLKVTDSRVPEGTQEENGVQFVYEVYENPNFNK